MGTTQRMKMSLGSRGYSRAINSDAKHDGSDAIVFLSSPL